MLWILSLLVTLLCGTEGKLTVIGAGMGRTGTSSLKIALEQLGFGKTHHMREVFNSMSGGFGHINGWIEALNATFDRRVAIFDEMFADSEFHSIVDQPGSHFYKELCTLYPDAKVILTERDSPEAWFKSVRDSVGQFTTADTAEGFWRNPGIWLLMHLNPVFGRLSRLISGMPVPRTLDQDAYVSFYKDWSAEVREYFKDQPEKLLIFNAKQGWEPLCKFLGVPVPSNPYPRVNESEGKQKVFIILNLVGVLHLLVLLWLGRWGCRKAVALCGKKNKTS